MTSPALREVRVDNWVLRCIFNKSIMVDRLASGEFTLAQRNKGNKSPNPNHPIGAKGQYFAYRDRQGNEVATVHYFHLNGDPLTPHDPKSVTVGNVRYLSHSDKLMAEPQKRYFND